MPLGTVVNSVLPGQTVTYRLNVINSGPQNATGVQAKVAIFGPTGASLSIAALPGGMSCTPSGGSPGSEFICTLGTVIGNKEWLFQATPSAPGPLFVVIIAEANEVDPQTGNNHATADITVLTPTADIRAVVSAEMPLGTVVNSVLPGQTVTYRLNVINSGPQNATGVKAKVAIFGPTGASLSIAALPGGMSCTPSGGSPGSEFICTLGTVIGNKEWLFQATPSAPGPLSVVIIAEANEVDHQTGNNQAAADITVLTPTADIRAVVSAEMPLGTVVNSVLPGQTVTYRLNVLNSGPQNATGVKAKVAIFGPTGASLSIATLPGGMSCTPSGGSPGSEFICTLGAVIGNKEWLFQATPSAPGPLSVVIIAEANESDPQAANNQAGTTVTVVAPVPRIVVTRSLTRNAQNVIVATITLTNNTSATAQAVSVTVATIGRVPAISGVPSSAVDIAPGSSTTIQVLFPGTAGGTGATTSLTIGGIYTGGSFNFSSRIVLP
ncbi:MAG: hypothetical protein IANPNBLG_04676 [Bryobacteraceae bacterium]|nr:hypothetical protein [Bryobacteraceae bacterium]